MTFFFCLASFSHKACIATFWHYAPELRDGMGLPVQQGLAPTSLRLTLAQRSLARMVRETDEIIK